MMANLIEFLMDTLVWSGMLIALVLVLRRPVARIFGAGIAYALWLLPLLRLVMPPLVLPAWLAPAAVPAPVTQAPASEIVTLSLAAPAAPALVLPWELLLSAAWLGGAALFLIARVIEYREMRARLLAQAATVDLREGVRIVETPAVAAPVAFGVRDKVIAVPPRFLISGALAERELALQHELAHHRGRDLLANMLAQGVLALHWFNPLAWAAWSAMRRDQEAACDARAMAGHDLPTRAAYARVIASFAAGPRFAMNAALAAPMACPISLGAGLGDKSIVHRLRSLTMSDISPRRRRAARWLLGAGAALALPLTATVVYAGQDAPEPPVAPLAPVAPAAPQAPEPPVAPEAPLPPRIVKKVIVIHEDEHDSEHGEKPDGEARFERRIERDGKTIVLRSHRELDEAQLAAKLAQIDARLAGLGALGAQGDAKAWAEAGKGLRTMTIRRQPGSGDAPAARVMMFDASDCGPGKDTQVEADASASGQREVVRVALCGVGPHSEIALKAIRQARASIASDDAMSGDIRTKVLRELDETIAQMEQDAR